MTRWGLIWGSLLLASMCGCDAQSSSGKPETDAGDASTSASSAPWWTLPAGSNYFVRDGRAAPLMLRNISAPDVGTFSSLLADAHSAGAQAVRVQLTQGFGYDTLGITSNGAVGADWAASWDAVFEAAQQQGLAVIPVFAIWGDWNDGTPDLGWIHFSANPLNQVLGGPAAIPGELFDAGSATQQAWLGWAAQLVERWHKYPNIIAWETFSELDLASGTNEMNATDFAERASDVVRANDPEARPVFASTSDLPLIQNAPWTTFWSSRGADLTSLHVYDANLDQTVLTRVQAARSLSSKPIFIGESGLDAAAPDGTTLTSAAAARAGLEQAVWTELVSGAATARVFYWEDGYAIYYPQTGLPLVKALNDVGRIPAQWLGSADYSALEPVSATASSPAFLAAVASDDEARGWIRSQDLAPPAWTAAPLGAVDIEISLSASASDGAWTVTFTTPMGEMLPQAMASSAGHVLAVTSPAGYTSLAFVATRAP